MWTFNVQPLWYFPCRLSRAPCPSHYTQPLISLLGSLLLLTRYDWRVSRIRRRLCQRIHSCDPYCLARLLLWAHQLSSVFSLPVYSTVKWKRNGLHAVDHLYQTPKTSYNHSWRVAGSRSSNFICHQPVVFAVERGHSQGLHVQLSPQGQLLFSDSLTRTPLTDCMLMILVV